MNEKTVLIAIIVIMAVAWIGLLVVLCETERDKERIKGLHHCNYCEVSFILLKKDLKRTYCQYCGKALTKHKHVPEYVEERKVLEHEKDL